MTVELDPLLAKEVEERIRTGEYPSVTEAVNSLLAAALGVVVHQTDAELEHLREAIALGVAEAERGELAEWDSDEMWAEAERLDAEEQARKQNPRSP